MIESPYTCRSNRSMDVADFYTIETPPSSSTSKDSTDESFSSLFQSKSKFNSSKIDIEQRSNYSNICSPIKSNVRANSNPIKDDECDFSSYDDNHTPLRRTLGNTKLKTRQDVRRFRKFLKRNYDLSSMALVDIDPDTMRTYLIHYLTSIRTRKGLKYDPETLRSYYLSIQRFLKDSNYPYCLRNSPQFTQCRDLIIQMRKEKHQTKSQDVSLNEMTEIKAKRSTVKKASTEKSICTTTSIFDESKQQQQHQDVQPDDQSNSPKAVVPITSHNHFTSTKDLPSSSLPPRKRQQMKYFLEFSSPCDFIFLPQQQQQQQQQQSSLSSARSPSCNLSSDAYILLAKLTHLTSSVFPSSLDSSMNQHCIQQIEQLLDESPACGYVQRMMLSTLCHEWTGDIRLIHANLRPELNSLLPHILILNTVLSRNTY